jgi:hypothetical protein
VDCTRGPGAGIPQRRVPAGAPGYGDPSMADTLTVKKKCCKSGPRCKKCPVVWKRLETEGLAVRLDKRTYEPAKKIPGKAFKAARR